MEEEPQSYNHRHTSYSNEREDKNTTTTTAAAMTSTNPTNDVNFTSPPPSLSFHAQKASSKRFRNMPPPPPLDDDDFFDLDDNGDDIDFLKQKIAYKRRSNRPSFGLSNSYHKLLSPPPPPVKEEDEGGGEHDGAAAATATDKIKRGSSMLSPPPPPPSLACPMDTPQRSNSFSSSSSKTPQQQQQKISMSSFTPEQLSSFDFRTPSQQTKKVCNAFTPKQQSLQTPTIDNNNGNNIVPSLIRQLSITELDRQQRIKREEMQTEQHHFASEQEKEKMRYFPGFLSDSSLPDDGLEERHLISQRRRQLDLTTPSSSFSATVTEDPYKTPLTNAQSKKIVQMSLPPPPPNAHANSFTTPSTTNRRNNGEEIITDNFTTPSNNPTHAQTNNNGINQKIHLRPNPPPLLPSVAAAAAVPPPPTTQPKENHLERMKNYCPRCGGLFKFRAQENINHAKEKGGGGNNNNKHCHCGREEFLKEEEEHVKLGQVIQQQSSSQSNSVALVGNNNGYYYDGMNGSTNFFPSPASDRFVLQFPSGGEDGQKEEEGNNTDDEEEMVEDVELHIMSLEDNSEDEEETEEKKIASNLQQILQSAMTTQPQNKENDEQAPNSTSSSSSSTPSRSSTSTSSSAASCNHYNKGNHHEKPIQSASPQKSKKQKILLKPKITVPPPPPLFDSSNHNSSSESSPVTTTAATTTTAANAMAARGKVSAPPPIPPSPLLSPPTLHCIPASNAGKPNLKRPIPRLAPPPSLLSHSNSAAATTTSSSVERVRAAPRDVRKSLLKPPPSVGSIAEEIISNHEAEEQHRKTKNLGGGLVPPPPPLPTEPSAVSSSSSSSFSTRVRAAPRDVRKSLSKPPSSVGSIAEELISNQEVEEQQQQQQKKHLGFSKGIKEIQLPSFSSSPNDDYTNDPFSAYRERGPLHLPSLSSSSHSAEQVAMAVEAAARFIGGSSGGLDQNTSTSFSWSDTDYTTPKDSSSGGSFKTKKHMEFLKQQHEEETTMARMINDGAGLKEDTRYQQTPSQNEIPIQQPRQPQLKQKEDIAIKPSDSDDSFLFIPRLGSSLNFGGDGGSISGSPPGAMNDFDEIQQGSTFTRRKGDEDGLSASAHDARMAASDFFGSIRKQSGGFYNVGCTKKTNYGGFNRDNGGSGSVQSASMLRLSPEKKEEEMAMKSESTGMETVAATTRDGVEAYSGEGKAGPSLPSMDF